MNLGPVRELCRTVDAIKIDLKGFNEEFYEEVCFATLQPVLDTIKLIHEEGVHLEIVNLMVPTLNDDPDELRELARWIVDTVGPDVPTHFNRFHPQYQLMNLPSTPVESLEAARAVAMEEGINYAYVGNVPGHHANHTYCARCGEPIIARQGFAVLEHHLRRLRRRNRRPRPLEAQTVRRGPARDTPCRLSREDAWRNNDTRGSGTPRVAGSTTGRRSSGQRRSANCSFAAKTIPSPPATPPDSRPRILRSPARFPTGCRNGAQRTSRVSLRPSATVFRKPQTSFRN